MIGVRFVSHAQHVTRVTSELQKFGPTQKLTTEVMAVVIDDGMRRDFLQREVAADLLFAWDEAGVSLAHQYDLGQNYKSVRKFAALGDTKQQVRDAFRVDLALDVAAGAANRAAMACLVTAWQVAAEMTEKEIQARVEAKNLGVPRQVSFSDRNALLTAFERVHGRLEERETPSVDYISQKVEEVEQGELTASLLDEVGSKEESLNLGVQSSLDASGRLRITREKKKSKLPANSEELRAKLKLEGNTLIMLGAKFRNRAWFQHLTPNDFSRYADWLLGEKVFGLQVPKTAAEGMRPLNPPWATLLRFEHQVRKEAYKQAIRQNRSIQETLREALINAELKEVHFLSPVALSLTTPETNDTVTKAVIPGATEEEAAWVPNKFQKKGKGKGKQGRYDKRYGYLHSTTPDGRQICYAYQEGKCKGKCGRVDVCQLCLKPHPLKDCKFKQKAAKAAKQQQEEKKDAE